MRRTSLTLLRSSALLCLPALATGCPDDTSPVTGADTSSESSATDQTTSSTTNTTTMSTGMTGADSSSSGADVTSGTESSSSTDVTVNPDSSSSSGGDACGNGMIDPGEDCDGNDLGGEDCASQGFGSGTLACNACAFDTSGCVMQSCGNDTIEGTEMCDGTDLGGADCVSEGFPLGGTLGCHANCGDYDYSGCLLSICGSNEIEQSEVCDGTDLAGETCISQGFDSGTLACNGDCMSFDTTLCNVCGDGVATGTEACDGTDSNGVTCVDLGFDAGTPGCSPDCTVVTPGQCGYFHNLLFCSHPNAAIPDASSTTTDLLVEGRAGTVDDVNVYMQASHTSVGDLDVGVVHLDSTSNSALFSATCGGGDNVDATFDQDAGGFACSGGTPAISGSMAPEAPGDLDGLALAVGDGNGTWELQVADTAAGNTGTVEQWCVELTTVGDDADGECRLVNGVNWCFNQSACGQGCEDVCADLGMGIALDDPTWFAAQDSVGECQAISDAFGMTAPIQFSNWGFGCLEDDGITDTVGGGLTGALYCSSASSCPTQLRTAMDASGTACGSPGARRAICPCGGGLYGSECTFDTSLLPVNVHPGNYYGDFDFDGDCNLVVSGSFNMALYQVDAATGAVSTLSGAFPGASSINGVAYRPSDDLIYVAADSSAALYSVDAAGTTVQILAFPTTINAIAVAPPGFGSYGDQIFGAGVDGNVYAFDTSDGSTTNFGTPFAGILSDLVFDGSTDTLYVVANGGTVYSVDADATFSVFAAGFSSPDGLAINPGVEVYVADFSNGFGAVTAVDIASGGTSFVGNASFDGGYYVTGMLRDAAGTLLLKVSGANIDYLVP